MIPTARTLASGEAEAQRMIEFAKLHVTKALKAAADNVDYESVPYTDEYTISKHSILSAYPLKNIK